MYDKYEYIIDVISLIGKISEYKRDTKTHRNCPRTYLMQYNENHIQQ